MFSRGKKKTSYQHIQNIRKAASFMASLNETYLIFSKIADRLPSSFCRHSSIDSPCIPP